MKKINIEQKLSLFRDLWTPKIIAELNGQYVKLAKIQGDFVWHSHENEDELFFIVKGELTMHLRDKSVHLKKGDLFIVPKGVEHRPESGQETHILLFEPKSTAHTGAAVSEMTGTDQEWI